MSARDGKPAGEDLPAALAETVSQTTVDEGIDAAISVGEGMRYNLVNVRAFSVGEVIVEPVPHVEDVDWQPRDSKHTHYNAHHGHCSLSLPVSPGI